MSYAEKKWRKSGEKAEKARSRTGATRSRAEQRELGQQLPQTNDREWTSERTKEEVTACPWGEGGGSVMSCIGQGRGGRGAAGIPSVYVKAGSMVQACYDRCAFSPSHRWAICSSSHRHTAQRHAARKNSGKCRRRKSGGAGKVPMGRRRPSAAAGGFLTNGGFWSATLQ